MSCNPSLLAQPMPASSVMATGVSYHPQACDVSHGCVPMGMQSVGAHSAKTQSIAVTPQQAVTSRAANVPDCSVDDLFSDSAQKLVKVGGTHVQHAFS